MYHVYKRKGKSELEQLLIGGDLLHDAPHDWIFKRKEVPATAPEAELAAQ